MIVINTIDRLTVNRLYFGTSGIYISYNNGNIVFNNNFGESKTYYIDNPFVSWINTTPTTKYYPYTSLEIQFSFPLVTGFLPLSVTSSNGNDPTNVRIESGNLVFDWTPPNALDTVLTFHNIYNGSVSHTQILQINLVNPPVFLNWILQPTSLGFEYVGNSQAVAKFSHDLTNISGITATVGSSIIEFSISALDPSLVEFSWTAPLSGENVVFTFQGLVTVDNGVGIDPVNSSTVLLVDTVSSLQLSIQPSFVGVSPSLPNTQYTGLVFQFDQPVTNIRNITATPAGTVVSNINIVDGNVVFDVLTSTTVDDLSFNFDGIEFDNVAAVNELIIPIELQEPSFLNTVPNTPNTSYTDIVFQFNKPIQSLESLVTNNDSVISNVRIINGNVVFDITTGSSVDDLTFIFSDIVADDQTQLSSYIFDPNLENTPTFVGTNPTDPNTLYTDLVFQFNKPIITLTTIIPNINGPTVNVGGFLTTVTNIRVIGGQILFDLNTNSDISTLNLAFIDLNINNEVTVPIYIHDINGITMPNFINSNITSPNTTYTDLEFKFKKPVGNINSIIPNIPSTTISNIRYDDGIVLLDVTTGDNINGLNIDFSDITFLDTTQLSSYVFDKGFVDFPILSQSTYQPNTTYNGVVVEFERPILSIDEIIPSINDSVISNLQIVNGNLVFDITTGTNVSNLNFTYDDIVFGGNTIIQSLDFNRISNNLPAFLGQVPNQPNTTYNNLVFQFDEEISSISDIIPSIPGVTISNIRIENGNVVFDAVTGSDVDNLSFQFVDAVTTDNKTSSFVFAENTTDFVFFNGTIPSIPNTTYTDLTLQFGQDIQSVDSIISSSGTASNIRIIDGNVVFDLVTGSNTDDLSFTFNNLTDVNNTNFNYIFNKNFVSVPSISKTVDSPNTVYNDVVFEFIKPISSVDSITTNYGVISNTRVINGNILFDITTSDDITNIDLNFTNLTTSNNGIIPSLTHYIENDFLPSFIGIKPILPNVYYQDLEFKFSKPVTSIGDIQINTLGTIADIRVIDGNVVFDFAAGADISNLNFTFENVTLSDGSRINSFIYDDVFVSTPQFTTNYVIKPNTTTTDLTFQFPENISSISNITVSNPSVSINNIRVVNGQIVFDLVTGNDISNLDFTFTSLVDTDLNALSDVTFYKKTNEDSVIFGQELTQSNTTYTDITFIFDKPISSIKNIITDNDGTTISNIRVVDGRVLCDVTTGSDITDLKLIFLDLVDNDGGRVSTFVYNQELSNPIVGWNINTPNTKDYAYVNLEIIFTNPVVTNVIVPEIINTGTITNVSINNNNLSFDWHTPDISETTLFFKNIWDGNSFTSNSNIKVNLINSPAFLGFDNITLFSKSYLYTQTQNVVAQFSKPLSGINSITTNDVGSFINFVIVLPLPNNDKIYFEMQTGTVSSLTLTFNDVIAIDGTFDSLPIENVTITLSDPPNNPHWVSLQPNNTNSFIDVQLKFNKNIVGTRLIQTNLGEDIFPTSFTDGNIHFNYTPTILNNLTFSLIDVIAFDGGRLNSIDVSLYQDVSVEKLYLNNTYYISTSGGQLYIHNTDGQTIPLTSFSNTTLGNTSIIPFINDYFITNLFFNLDTTNPLRMNDTFLLSGDTIVVDASGNDVKNFIGVVPTTKSFDYIQLRVEFTYPLINHVNPVNIVTDGTVSNISIDSGNLLFDWTTPNLSSTTLTFNNIYDGVLLLTNETFDINLFDPPVFAQFQNFTVFSKSYHYKGIIAEFDLDLSNVDSITVSDGSTIQNISILNNTILFDWIVQTTTPVTITFTSVFTVNGAHGDVDIILNLVDPPTLPHWENNMPFIPQGVFNQNQISFNTDITSLNTVTSSLSEDIPFTIVNGNVQFDYLPRFTVAGLTFTLNDVVDINGGRINDSVVEVNRDTSVNTLNIDDHLISEENGQLKLVNPDGNTILLTSFTNTTLGNVSIQTYLDTYEISNLYFFDNTTYPLNITDNYIQIGGMFIDDAEGNVIQNWVNVIPTTKQYPYVSLRLSFKYPLQTNITPVQVSGDGIFNNVTLVSGDLVFDWTPPNASSAQIIFNNIWDGLSMNNITYNVDLFDAPIIQNLSITDISGSFNYTNIQAIFNENIQSVSSITSDYPGENTLVVQNIVNNTVIFDWTTGTSTPVTLIFNNLITLSNAIDIPPSESITINLLQPPLSPHWTNNQPIQPNTLYSGVEIGFNKNIVSINSVIADNTLIHSIVNGNVIFDITTPNDVSTLTFTLNNILANDNSQTQQLILNLIPDVSVDKIYIDTNIYFEWFEGQVYINNDNLRVSLTEFTNTNSGNVIVDHVDEYTVTNLSIINSSVVIDTPYLRVDDIIIEDMTGNTFTGWVSTPTTRLYPYTNLQMQFNYPVLNNTPPVEITSSGTVSNISINSGNIQFDWVAPDVSNTTLIVDNVWDGSNLISGIEVDVVLDVQPVLVSFVGITEISKSYNFSGANKLSIGFDKPISLVSNIVASDGSVISNININNTNVEFDWITQNNSPVTLTFNGLVSTINTLDVPPNENIIVNLIDQPNNANWFQNQPTLPNTVYTDCRIRFNKQIFSIDSIIDQDLNTVAFTGLQNGDISFDYTTTATVNNISFTINEIIDVDSGRYNSFVFASNQDVSVNSLFLTPTTSLRWENGQVIINEDGRDIVITDFTNTNAGNVIVNSVDNYTVSNLYINNDIDHPLNVDGDFLEFGDIVIEKITGNSPTNWIVIPTTKSQPYTNLQLQFELPLVQNVPNVEIVGSGVISNISVNSGLLEFDWTTPNDANVTLTINNIFDGFSFINGETFDVVLFDSPTIIGLEGITDITKSYNYTGANQLVAVFSLSLLSISSITTSDGSVVSNISINNNKINFDWLTLNSSSVTLTFNGLVAVNNISDAPPTEILNVTLLDPPSDMLWFNNQPSLPNTSYTDIQIKFNKNIVGLNTITSHLAENISFSFVNGNISFDYTTQTDVTIISFVLSEIVADDNTRINSITINLIDDFSLDQLYLNNDVFLSYSSGKVVLTNNENDITTIATYNNLTPGNVVINPFIDSYFTTNLYIGTDRNNYLHIDNELVLINDIIVSDITGNTPSWFNVIPTTKSYNYIGLILDFKYDILPYTTPITLTPSSGTISNVTIVNGQLVFDWLTSNITNADITINNIWDGTSLVDSENISVQLFDTPTFLNFNQTTLFSKSFNYSQITAVFNVAILSVDSITTDNSSVINNPTIITDRISFNLITDTSSSLTISFDNLVSIDGAIDTPPPESVTVPLADVPVNPHWIVQPLLPNTVYTDLEIRFDKDISLVDTIVSNLAENLNHSISNGSILFNYNTPGSVSATSFTLSNVTASDGGKTSSVTIGVTDNISVDKLYFNNTHYLSWNNGQPDIRNDINNTFINFTLFGNSAPGNVDVSPLINEYTITNLYFGTDRNNNAHFEDTYFQVGDVIITDYVGNQFVGWVSTPTTKSHPYVGLQMQFTYPLILNTPNVTVTTSQGTISNIALNNGDLQFDWTTSNDSVGILTINNLWDGSYVEELVVNVDLYDPPEFISFVGITAFSKSFNYSGTTKLAAQFNLPLSSVDSISTSDGSVVSNISINNDTINFDWLTLNSTSVELTFNNVLTIDNALDNNPVESVVVTLNDPPVNPHWSNVQPFRPSTSYTNIQIRFNTDIASVESITSNFFENITGFVISNGSIQFDYTTPSVVTNSSFTLVNVVDVNNGGINSVTLDLNNDTSVDNLTIGGTHTLSWLNGQISILDISENINITFTTFNNSVVGNVPIDLFVDTYNIDNLYFTNDLVNNMYFDGTFMLVGDMIVKDFSGNSITGWSGVVPKTKLYNHTGLRLEFESPIASGFTPSIQISGDGTFSNVQIVSGRLGFDWILPNLNQTTLIVENIWDNFTFVSREEFTIDLFDEPIFLNFVGITIFSKSYNYTGGNAVIAQFNTQLSSVSSISTSDGSVVSNINVINDTVVFDWNTSSQSTVTLTFNGIVTSNDVLDAIPLINTTVNLVDQPINGVWLTQPTLTNTLYNVEISFDLDIVSVNSITSSLLENVGFVITNGNIIITYTTPNDITGLSFTLNEILAVNGGRYNSFIMNITDDLSVDKLYITNTEYINFSNGQVFYNYPNGTSLTLTNFTNTSAGSLSIDRFIDEVTSTNVYFSEDFSDKFNIINSNYFGSDNIIVEDITGNFPIGWTGEIPANKSCPYTDLLMVFKYPLVDGYSLPIGITNELPVSGVNINGVNLEIDWTSPNANTTTFTVTNIWDGRMYVNTVDFTITLYDEPVFDRFTNTTVFSKSFNYSGAFTINAQFDIDIISISNITTDDGSVISNVSVSNGLVLFDWQTTTSSTVTLTFIDLQTINSTFDKAPYIQTVVNLIDPPDNPKWISNQPSLPSTLYTGVVVEFNKLVTNVDTITSSLLENIPITGLPGGGVQFNYTTPNDTTNLSFDFTNVFAIDNARSDNVTLNLVNDISSDKVYFDNDHYVEYINGQVFISSTNESIKLTEFSNTTIGSVSIDTFTEEYHVTNVYFNQDLSTKMFIDNDRLSVNDMIIKDVTGNNILSWDTQPANRNNSYTGLGLNFTYPLVSGFNPSIEIVSDGTVSNINIVGGKLTFDWDSPDQSSNTFTINNIWDGTTLVSGEQVTVLLYYEPLFLRIDGVTTFSKSYNYSGSSKLVAVFNQQIGSITSITTDNTSVTSNINIVNDTVEFDLLTDDSNSVTLTFNGLISANGSIDFSPFENTTLTLIDPPTNAHWFNNQPVLGNSVYTDIQIKFDKDIINVESIITNLAETVIVTSYSDGNVHFNYNTPVDTSNTTFTLTNIKSSDGGLINTLVFAVNENLSVDKIHLNPTYFLNSASGQVKINNINSATLDLTSYSNLASGNIDIIPFINEYNITNLYFNSNLNYLHINGSDLDIGDVSIEEILSVASIFSFNLGLESNSRTFDLLSIINYDTPSSIEYDYENIFEFSQNISSLSKITVNNLEVEFEIIPFPMNNIVKFNHTYNDIENTIIFHDTTTINGVNVGDIDLDIVLSEPPKNIHWSSDKKPINSNTHYEVVISFDKPIKSIDRIITDNLETDIIMYEIIGGNIKIICNTHNISDEYNFILTEVVSEDDGKIKYIELPVDNVVFWVDISDKYTKYNSKFGNYQYLINGDLYYGDGYIRNNLNYLFFANMSDNYLQYNNVALNNSFTMHLVIGSYDNDTLSYNGKYNILQYKKSFTIYSNNNFCYDNFKCFDTIKNEWFVFTYTYNSFSNILHFYKNGLLMSSKAANFNNSNKLIIGPHLCNAPWCGSIGELTIYNKIQNNTDINIIVNQLRDKWGIGIYNNVDSVVPFSLLFTDINIIQTGTVHSGIVEFISGGLKFNVGKYGANYGINKIEDNGLLMRCDGFVSSLKNIVSQSFVLYLVYKPLQNKSSHGIIKLSYNDSKLVVKNNSLIINNISVNLDVMFGCRNILMIRYDNLNNNIYYKLNDDSERLIECDELYFRDIALGLYSTNISSSCYVYEINLNNLDNLDNDNYIEIYNNLRIKWNILSFVKWIIKPEIIGKLYNAVAEFNVNINNTTVLIKSSVGSNTYGKIKDNTVSFNWVVPDRKNVTFMFDKINDIDCSVNLDLIYPVVIHWHRIHNNSNDKMLLVCYDRPVDKYYSGIICSYGDATNYRWSSPHVLSFCWDYDDDRTLPVSFVFPTGNRLNLPLTLQNGYTIKPTLNLSHNKIIIETYLYLDVNYTGKLNILPNFCGSIFFGFDFDFNSVVFGTKEMNVGIDNSGYYHCVFCYSGNNISIYINGIKKYSWYNNIPKSTYCNLALINNLDFIDISYIRIWGMEYSDRIVDILYKKHKYIYPKNTFNLLNQWILYQSLTDTVNDHKLSTYLTYKISNNNLLTFNNSLYNNTLISFNNNIKLKNNEKFDINILPISTTNLIYWFDSEKNSFIFDKKNNILCWKDKSRDIKLSKISGLSKYESCSRHNNFKPSHYFSTVSGPVYQTTTDTFFFNKNYTLFMVFNQIDGMGNIFTSGQLNIPNIWKQNKLNLLIVINNNGVMNIELNGKFIPQTREIIESINSGINFGFMTSCYINEFIFYNDLISNYELGFIKKMLIEKWFVYLKSEIFDNNNFNNYFKLSLFNSLSGVKKDVKLEVSKVVSYKSDKCCNVQYSIFGNYIKIYDNDYHKLHIYSNYNEVIIDTPPIGIGLVAWFDSSDKSTLSFNQNNKVIKFINKYNYLSNEFGYLKSTGSDFYNDGLVGKFVGSIFDKNIDQMTVIMKCGRINNKNNFKVNNFTIGYTSDERIYTTKIYNIPKITKNSRYCSILDKNIIKNKNGDNNFVEIDISNQLINVNLNNLEIDNEMSEIFVYDRVLSDDEIKKIDNYLNKKWEIIKFNNLPNMAAHLHNVTVETNYELVEIIDLYAIGCKHPYNILHTKNSISFILDLTNCSIGSDITLIFNVNVFINNEIKTRSQTIPIHLFGKPSISWVNLPVSNVKQIITVKYSKPILNKYTTGITVNKGFIPNINYIWINDKELQFYYHAGDVVNTIFNFPFVSCVDGTYSDRNTLQYHYVHKFSGLTLLLDASKCAYTNYSQCKLAVKHCDKITSWNDISGYSNVVFQKHNNGPMLCTNIVNGLPAITFDKSRYFECEVERDIFYGKNSEMTFASLTKPTEKSDILLSKQGELTVRIMNKQTSFIINPFNSSVYPQSVEIGKLNLHIWRYKKGFGSNLINNKKQYNFTADNNDKLSIFDKNSKILLGNLWDGLVCEIMCFNRYLTDNEISDLQQYMYEKWFISWSVKWILKPINNFAVVEFSKHVSSLTCDYTNIKYNDKQVSFNCNKDNKFIFNNIKSTSSSISNLELNIDDISLVHHVNLVHNPIHPNVIVHGDKLVYSTGGTIYTFRKFDIISTLTKDNLINFGYSISLSKDGNILAVGCPENKGITYIYVNVNDKWISQGKLVGFSNNTNETQGHCVRLSGNARELVVTSVDGFYVFTQNNGVWTQFGKFLLPNCRHIEYDGFNIIASTTDGFVTFIKSGNRYIQVGGEYKLDGEIKQMMLSSNLHRLAIRTNNKSYLFEKNNIWELKNTYHKFNHVFINDDIFMGCSDKVYLYNQNNHININAVCVAKSDYIYVITNHGHMCCYM